MGIISSGYRFLTGVQAVFVFLLGKFGKSGVDSLVMDFQYMQKRGVGGKYGYHWIFRQCRFHVKISDIFGITNPCIYLFTIFLKLFRSSLENVLRTNSAARYIPAASGMSTNMLKVIA